MTETLDLSKLDWLRCAVLVLAGLQLVLFVTVEVGVLLTLGGMEPITRRINEGFAVLMFVPFGVLTVPALVLGILDRWLVVALILALLPLPLIAWVISLRN